MRRGWRSGKRPESFGGVREGCRLAPPVAVFEIVELTASGCARSRPGTTCAAMRSRSPRCPATRQRHVSEREISRSPAQGWERRRSSDKPLG